MQYVYGDSDQEFGQLWFEPPADGPVPVVTLIHGGFWRDTYGLDIMVPLAEDLFAKGYAVWNIEYRRVPTDESGCCIDVPGGGWPNTLLDVANGIDYLAVLAEGLDLDLTRVAVVGHSAGGHLATWAGSRSLLEDHQPGHSPKVQPKLVVGQGAVVDLPQAGIDGLGNNAVVNLLGGLPDDVAQRYAAAQPRQGQAKVVLVNGELDETVPLRYSLGPIPDAESIVVSGTDHMALIDPKDDSWTAVLAVLEAEL